MTRRQSSLYWRLWNQARKAQGWDKLPTERQNHLRHDCHRRAIGYDKSSKDFDNQDFDRVKYWFRLIIDPDDIEATRFQQNPEAGSVKRMEVALQKFPEALVIKVCRDKFNKANWRDLQPGQVRQLMVTMYRILNRRSKAVEHDSDGTRPVQAAA